MRIFQIIFILIIASACSKNEVEKTEAAIDIALSYLTDGECEKAIDVLEDAGMQSNNADYLQVLASAHACKAGFKTMEFIDTDLGNIVTTNASTIVKSLASMTLSGETEADSDDYVSIRTGINFLLNSTSGSPSQLARDSKFGTRDSGDMGVQALILNLVNFGKFLHFYGNTNSAGVKGAGTGPNNCFIDYNDPRAQAVVTGATTGACVSHSDGHPDLDQSSSTGKRRMCEGIMLLTNTLDILDNVDLSGSSELSDLEDISAKVSSFKTIAVAAGLGDIIDMTSQEDCEDYAAVPAQLLDMEYFYALIFEVGLK